jgi:hypothetical protein
MGRASGERGYLVEKLAIKPLGVSPPERYSELGKASRKDTTERAAAVRE